ncbi:hypothetical protein B0T17DRAFT_509435 [Bombardia bombarda]|uniref:Uncharacterized protein n=1 Tax=Bombardia bombarda TaxID=252184 RepID=A0AA40BY38_9PEZI|nr:hypothetical protein B0T17DRAFT_509435 [Bombardia bombarda]
MDTSSFKSPIRQMDVYARRQTRTVLDGPPPGARSQWLAWLGASLARGSHDQVPGFLHNTVHTYTPCLLLIGSRLDEATTAAKSRPPPLPPPQHSHSPPPSKCPGKPDKPGCPPTLRWMLRMRLRIGCGCVHAPGRLLKGETTLAGPIWSHGTPVSVVQEDPGFCESWVQ